MGKPGCHVLKLVRHRQHVGPSQCSIKASIRVTVNNVESTPQDTIQVSLLSHGQLAKPSRGSKEEDRKDLLVKDIQQLIG